MDKISKKELIKLLVELNKVDQKIYKCVDPYNRYPEQGSGWFFLDYYNVLNTVYFEFCGKSQAEYYKEFKASNYDKEDKPVAWYCGQFSTKDDGSIKGPKGYKRFIPDCINDVILSSKINANKKLKLLNRMFKDLEKLKNNYIYNVNPKIPK